MIHKLSSKELHAEQAEDAQYNHSKLINVFFTRALAARMPVIDSKRVLVNCLNPGLCKSELSRSGKGIGALIHGIMVRLLGYTSEEGSRQILYAALSGKDDPKLEKELQGAYIHFSHVSEPSDFVISEIGKDAQDRIWAETIDILANQDPTIRDIAKGGLV